MLFMASCHSIELTQLLYKLMHSKHSGGQSLTFFIDVLCALDNLIIKNLIWINKICHFAAENGAVLDHLSWHFAVLGNNTVHVFDELVFIGSLHNFSEFFYVLIMKPFLEEFVWFKLLASDNSLQESTQIFFSPFDRFFWFLLLFVWKWRNNHVRKIFDQDFSQKVKVGIFPHYCPVYIFRPFRLCGHFIQKITGWKNSARFQTSIRNSNLYSFVEKWTLPNLRRWYKWSLFFHIFSSILVHNIEHLLNFVLSILLPTVRLSLVKLLVWLLIFILIIGLIICVLIIVLGVVHSLVHVSNAFCSVHFGVIVLILGVLIMLIVGHLITFLLLITTAVDVVVLHHLS